MKQKKFAILALLAGLSAQGPVSAHVSFEEKSVEAGAMTVAGFRVFHGCDGSETVEVSVDLPEGLQQVRPRALPGWTLAITQEQLETPFMLHGEEITERVSRITWSGGALPDFAFEKFEFHAKLPDRAGETLYFPVHQKCVEGELSWTAQALPGEADYPAPQIKLLPNTSQNHSHH